MRKVFIGVILLGCLLAFPACDGDKKVEEELDYIKAVGDSQPSLAMLMLDSIRVGMNDFSEHTQMKIGLLGIRLRDKAYIDATSDLGIKKVLAYFLRHGNPREKQEAYYYAGSVYRDLKDYPRSIVNFRYALQYGEQGEGTDSLMLRNTYSNLGFVYDRVQDYRDAMAMSEKEYKLAKELGVLNLLTILSLGIDQKNCGQKGKAKSTFRMALGYMKSNNLGPEVDYSLLFQLSSMKMRKEADSCYRIICNSLPEACPSNKNLALGEYFRLCNKTDSALAYFKKGLEDKTDTASLYNCSKKLFILYSEINHVDSAYHYAKLYLKESEDMDFGKRQLQAATANNLYQYHSDQKRERKVMGEGAFYRKTAWWTVGVAVPVVALLAFFYFYYWKRSSSEIFRQRASLRKYKEKMERQKKELETERNQLEQTKAKLEKMVAETEQCKAELAATQRLLEEKRRQNKDIIRLLHRAEAEEKASEVIGSVKALAKKGHVMEEGMWKKLFVAVDEIDPGFKETLASQASKASMDEVRLAYLLRIGLTNNEIQSVTGMSRTTLWRWTKAFSWIRDGVS